MEQVLYLQNEDGVNKRVVAAPSRIYYSHQLDNFVLFTPLPELKQYLVEKGTEEGILTKLPPHFFGLIYVGDL